MCGVLDDLALAAVDQVAALDADRLDLDEQSAAPDLRIGHVLVAQHLRAAVVVVHRRLHDPNSSVNSCFNTRRSSLPVSLYGSSSRNSMWAGIFDERRLRFTQSCSSCSDVEHPAAMHDGGDDLLAPLGVGHADDAGVGDGGMPRQHVLDLTGRHVLGAAHDHVVEPALEVEVPVVVERPGVLRREPAVDHHVGAPEVLAGDLLAAHPDLAGLAGTDGLAVDVADLDLERRQRPADRAEAAAHGGVVGGDGVRWSSGPRTAIVELVSVSP